MKAIILAAGRGLRLQPVNKGKTKSLLSIGGKTLFERIVSQCASLGIKDFLIVGGYGLPSLKNEINKLKRNVRNFEIVVNKSFKTTNTGFSLNLALDRLEDEDFLVINGDMLFHPQILKDLVSSPVSAISLDDFKELTKESIKVVVENGVIKEITKFVEVERSQGEYIGLAKIVGKDKKLFQKILKKIVGEDQNAYYDYAFAPLSQKTTLSLVSTKRLSWTEIDDINDFKKAKSLVKEGLV